jgi:radical S-adenosyl methionine domain-containing protein 2
MRVLLIHLLGKSLKISSNMKNQFIPAVNYHLWEPCNMRCKFCFATFQDVKRTVLPKGHLSRHKSLDLISRLAEFGFEKKTFVGGEPTLCPWLGELIVKAKAMGMVTMLVTNGSNLSDAFLK